MRTAIIGGGLAGLACARALAEHGRETVLFDKGRDVGGRMCGKRLSTGAHADHGARGFTARDPRFLAQVRSWIQAGVAAEWMPKLASISEPGAAEFAAESQSRYIGVPAMHAPVRAMAEAIAGDVEIRRGVGITQVHRCINRSGGIWNITDSDGNTESFDAVAIATPAPTAAALLAEIPHLRKAAASVPMAACWATIARFDDRLPIEFDAARVSIGGRHATSGALAWISRESGKPGRPDDEVWVLHATDEWSRDRLDADRAEIGNEMLSAFFEATGAEPVEAAELRAHRWKSAFPVAPLCDGCLFDEDMSIGACGDWCMGARVEPAYLSGLAMAARLLGEKADFLAPSPAAVRNR